MDARFSMLSFSGWAIMTLCFLYGLGRVTSAYAALQAAVPSPPDPIHIVVPDWQKPL